MADENKIDAPLPYDPADFTPDSGASRPPIDRKDEADFIVRPSAFGSGEHQLFRGDKVSKADLAKLGVTEPKRFKELVANDSIRPLRAVDLTPATPKEKGK